MKGMISNGVDQLQSDTPSLSSSYEAAMEALSSLISQRRRGNGSKRDGSKKVGTFPLMFKYLKILELEEPIARLKVIHVAGTKGKGSTCTFCEAILRECGLRTGLFTSPHLIDVRERFRIDGLDISEDKFLHYFWGCWNQLKENLTEDLPMPPLFRFLTLLAFKIFSSEEVDVVILEVGLGGRLDATNVVKKPVVCGITSLGMDHMEILGDSLGQIAFEKAGIFKPGVPAFTVAQLPEAMDVLETRSSELKVPLQVALPLDPNKLCGLKLGLAGDHQLINAGLAVLLCKSWLQNTGHTDVFHLKSDNKESDLPEVFIRGLSNACLLGRAQIVSDTSVNYDKSSECEESSGDLIFYLDGAHTPESMEVCAKWFSNVVKEDKRVPNGIKSGYFVGSQSTEYEIGNFDGSNKISKRILLFNCMDVRDPQILLPQLFNTCSSRGVHFSKALFVPSMSTYNKVDPGISAAYSNIPKDLSWQFTLQRTWEKMVHGKEAIAEETLELDNPETLPLFDSLSGDPYQKCDPVAKEFVCSSVISSLPMTITWLRECVKKNPSLRVQVLVTGSLHLIGDVLKLLRR